MFMRIQVVRIYYLIHMIMMKYFQSDWMLPEIVVHFYLTQKLKYLVSIFVYEMQPMYCI